MDKFDAMRASQTIEDFFINDLSLWYIRRSRKRFGSQHKNDKEAASRTLYFALLQIAKLIGPLMPFLAEEVYQKLRNEDMSESVHLCDWPVVDEKMIDNGLEEQMKQVREIVSLALAKRTELGIRVRQPLALLKVKAGVGDKGVSISSDRSKMIQIKHEQGLIDLIKDEVNVKEVLFDDKIKEEVELDTKITKELKQEGQVREVIRQVQALRKKAGLTLQDKDIILYYFGNDVLNKLLKKNKKEILEQTNTKKVKENQDKKGEFLAQNNTKVDNQPFWLALAKT